MKIYFLVFQTADLWSLQLLNTFALKYTTEDYFDLFSLYI